MFNKYSLGMKQKLALVQAFMEEPELIILDEPTNALDEESIINLRDILMDFRKKGVTVLIASHNRSEIESLSDKIFNINLGKLKEVI